MESKVKALKLGCAMSNVTMALVANLPPILFMTFHAMYGVSYSLLGLLVLINFFTQLLIDLVFSFFSHKFNIPVVVKMMPLLAVVGLAIYALWPFFLPDSVYVGLVIGTVIFSAASGLSEVLISPLIASIPAKDPDRQMSKIHSAYAWGVVGVIGIATVFFLTAGRTYWQWLTLGFTVLPLLAFALFCASEIPNLDTPKKSADAFGYLKNKGLWLSVFAIFLGGASECTMAQWSSGYLEQALGIDKVYGDIFGVAMFAMMLGLGRSLYSKYGKNVGKVLVLGAVGASACYLISALSGIPVIGLISCAATGFFVSMLWPGNLFVASERFPDGGVFIYALMAAGGDMGASVGPQLVGIVTDAVIAHPQAAEFAARFGMNADQLGLKTGMLVGMLFPLAAIPLFLYNWKHANGGTKR